MPSIDHLRRAASLLLLFVAGCDEPEPDRSLALEVVDQHLRAIEAGQWDRALELLAEDFQFTGVAPVPVPKSGAMLSHQLRRRAFPDFRFNEEVLEDDGATVRIAVHMTGTHLGVFDYRMIGVPEVVQPTCKTVALPPEYFEFAVDEGLIIALVGEIPDGGGAAAALEQIGGPDAESECE